MPEPKTWWKLKTICWRPEVIAEVAFTINKVNQTCKKNRATFTSSKERKSKNLFVNFSILYFGGSRSERRNESTEIPLLLDRLSPQQSWGTKTKPGIRSIPPPFPRFGKRSFRRSRLGSLDHLVSGSIKYFFAKVKNDNSLCLFVCLWHELKH